jgi:uroporphyrinogen decarboxylase
MTKHERVLAALDRRPVDRPPISFWRHVPELDHDPRRLADAMLAFHRRLDLDFIKLMSSGVYCVEDWGCRVAYTGLPSGAKQCTEHAVKTTADWARIRPLDPGAGALGRELEALRLTLQGRDDGAPVIHTVFSPLTIARKLAGDRLREDLQSAPDTVTAALEAITVTTAHYAQAALDVGADGIFFATQAASPETFSLAEAQRFDAPYAQRILESVHPRSAFTLLHIHGRDIYFDQLGALPAHAVNWHDRLTNPTLAEGLARRTAGAVVGGLSEGQTLRRGPREAIAAEVADAIRQTHGLGLILGPGCGVPLDVPEAHLAAAVGAVKASAAR